MNIIIPPEHIGQFTIYQVDMNEVMTGQYLLTRHRLPELLYRVRSHAWNLVKAIYRQNRKRPSNLEFQLVLKIIFLDYPIRTHLQAPTVVSLGNYNDWENNIFRWFNLNIDGCNIYVDMFYILSYEKSAV